MANRVTNPICHVVAGPNGAGKTTFALDYLPTYAGSITFVNPDMMAHGFSPIDIRLSAIKSGRLTLKRIGELISERDTFGFETTLSGVGHLKLLRDAKADGYAIHLYYLWIPNQMMLPSRIRHRVLAGGHDVPTEDVFRRYSRSIKNLPEYAKIADVLYVFDATKCPQEMIYCRNGAERMSNGRLSAKVRMELAI